MINPHFELVVEWVCPALLNESFLESLQCWRRVSIESRAVYGPQRTVHKLGLLRSDVKIRVVSFVMHREDVKTDTSLVALGCNRSFVPLDREIDAHCACTVADETVGIGEAAALNEIMKQVVQSFLP